MDLRWGVLFSLLVLGISGCAAPLEARRSLPDRYTVVRQPLVLHSDFPLPSHHRLLEDLTARRADLGRTLELPNSDEPVHVYLFDDPQGFEAFFRRQYPDLPQRRALFIETDTRLTVYAQWGDRVAEDLRHEVAHAYLHAVVPNLPLWLDEGLAEYFEVPRGREGRHPAHLELLAAMIRDRRWQPDLRRLEHLTQALAMSQEDYAECWAWVHFLLHAHPVHAALLRGYLKDLRQQGAAEPLSARMGQGTGAVSIAVIDYVQQLLGPDAR